MCARTGSSPELPTGDSTNHENWRLLFSEAGGFCFYTFEPANVRLALMKVGHTAGSNEGGPYDRPLTRK